MSYALSATVHQPYDHVVARVRDVLGDHGFSIITEFDLHATLHAKLGVEVLPQIVLGACSAPLAFAAVQAEPSIGLLLPCNVVVRALDKHTTIVEALDPQTMVGVTANSALQPIADDATRRLAAALESLSAVPAGGGS